jgi:excisionase family DNA binding protein
VTDARPEPAGPAYDTPEQVAARLQLSTKTIMRWLAADTTMPALKIGGVTRFPRERLERWLRNREQGPGRVRRPRNPLPVLAKSGTSTSPPKPCANP